MDTINRILYKLQLLWEGTYLPDNVLMRNWSEAQFTSITELFIFVTCVPFGMVMYALCHCRRSNWRANMLRVYRAMSLFVVAIGLSSMSRTLAILLGGNMWYVYAAFNLLLALTGGWMTVVAFKYRGSFNVMIRRAKGRVKSRKLATEAGDDSV